MKATLLALLTLGSLAMAAEEPQTLTIIPDYNAISTEKADVGSYDAVVFQLVNNGDRTTVLGGADLTTTVTLSSIEIACKNKESGLAGWCPIITDATGKVIAYSDSGATLDSHSHGSDWGWKYTRNFATLTGFKNADLVSDTVTLTLGNEYRLYLGTSAQVSDLWDALFNALVQQGEPVTISPDYYTPKALAVTTVGAFTEASAREYSLMNGESLPGKSWAPLMGVTVLNSNVPEPTTGTLSLLALAGLCIRRRK